MARARYGVPLASMALDATLAVPLYQQLYASLKRAILNGQVRPGSRLPSTRTLAADLQLSRNTVTVAFEQLLAEGYLEARIGSGTQVVSSLPDDFLRPSPKATRSRTDQSITLSRWGTSTQPLGAEFQQMCAPAPARDPCPFQSGVPAVDQFPAALWARYVARCWRHAPRQLFQYGDPAGLPALREAIAAYVSAARAVRCDAERVIVLAGTQQGLYLAARLLAEPGDRVWIEDPGFPGARNTFQSAGLQTIPVAVDSGGLVVPPATRSVPRPRLIYVTPSHQFPLGVTMTLPRRLALLEFAARSDAWILEDDYDSEYRYTCRPIPSLQGLTDDSRVIYLGTFSKVLVPALRLGYAIVPKSLVGAFQAARALIDMHSPSIDQAALAGFIADGHFERHIRRMRTVYEERRAVLIEAARRDLGDVLDVTSPAAGLHLVGWLPSGVRDRRAAQAAVRHGVRVIPLSALTLEHRTRPGLVLSYGGFTADQIRGGVSALARALANA